MKPLFLFIFLVLPFACSSEAFGFGLFKSIEQLQSEDVVNPLNWTVYGAKIQEWQRDTSREYHLSRDGLWKTSNTPQTREYTFELSEVETVVGGIVRNMTLINGKFPGPVIEANMGDRIIVNLINNGPNTTSLHFHGLFQRGTNYMDGSYGITQCGIEPGSSFVYNFTVEDQYGTYWYHSHYSTQYIEGIEGPIVIHSVEEDDLTRDLYDEDYIIMLSDIYFDNSMDLISSYMGRGVENVEPVPDSGVINGMVKSDCARLQGSKYTCKQSPYPQVPVKPDKVYRFRIISAGGFSEFEFSVDGHKLIVIEADGTITEPLEVDVVPISTAQRYSVLLNTSDADPSIDAFWMRATMGTNCYRQSNPYLNTDLKAILSYPQYTLQTMANGGIPLELPVSNKTSAMAGNTKCMDLDPYILHCAKKNHTVPEKDQLIYVDASFQIGAFQISRGYMNSSSHVPDQTNSTLNRFYAAIDINNQEVFSTVDSTPQWANGDFVSTVPEPIVADILINNFDDGSHPFHLHGYKFWVLAYGKGWFHPNLYENIEISNPVMRDTVQVKGYEWLLLRVVLDNPGIWAFHCHFLWHTVAGMLMQFNILPDRLREQTPPQDWYALCPTK